MNNQNTTVREYNEDGTFTDRLPTTDEAALAVADNQIWLDQQAAVQTAATAKAALFKRLGITADEAALLLG